MSNDKNFDINDILDDDTKDDEEENEGPDIEELQTKIEELSKEKKGLLTATKEERRKRQEISAQLNELKEAVGSIISQRQRDAQELDGAVKGDSSKSATIPVEYDEDGNAWVDPKAIEPLLSPYQQKIQDLEQKLQLSNSANVAAVEAEKIKQSIIGENEQYQAAAGKYRAARKWVEDQVVEFSKLNNINRPMSSGEALDYVFDKELKQEFEERFGKIDLVDIVTAEDSKLLFKRALENISKIDLDTDNPKPNDKMDNRFQKVLNKPSSFGNQQNAKSGQLSIFDKIGNLSPTDILELTDDQVEALQRAALREEKEGGIKF